MTSFLAASKLNYTCDQVRRRMNVHFGWSHRSESAATYTVDAAQRMIHRPVFPGFRPLFDLFRFGDLVTAVLQESDPSICLLQAIRDQPATRFESWNVRYDRSAIAGRVDLKPSTLQAFPNGLALKEDIDKKHSTNKIDSAQALIEARPDKGQIDAQLDCFNHTRQAMRKAEMNQAAVAAGPDGFIPKSSASASASSNPPLSAQTIIDTNFVPAPIKQRGRPRFQDEIKGIFPNAGLRERSRSNRRKISAAEANKIIEEELPQFKDLKGRMFKSRGHPKKNPSSDDFSSKLHEEKYWALRRILNERGLKL
jgi:hypothetical protein